jgi:hypothetical protein
VKDAIAVAARTDESASGEQITAVIERATAQRTGLGVLH